MKMTMIAVLFLAAALYAQQADASWVLRHPQKLSSVIYGNHPGNGRPLRLDQGNPLNPGHDPSVLWELVGNDWVRLVELQRPARLAWPWMLRDVSRGEMLMFAVPPGDYREHTYAWNGMDWRLQPHPALYAPRADFAAACDIARSRVVLFGGIGASGPLNDTWEWDGHAWQLRQLVAPPSPRSQHAMAYDPIRRRIVLFGGTDASLQVLGDTWEYDGSFWVRIATPVSPPARNRHALVYDPTRQRTVLTGGWINTTWQHEDTWEWDGTFWHQIVNAPPRQVNWTVVDSPTAHVVHDVATGRLLRFQRPNDEILSYSGNSWQVVATTTPQSRMRPAMIYDSQRRQVMMFGGGRTNQSLGDAWLWDGFRWQRTDPLLAPGPRAEAAMAFDRARGDVVLFGGAATSSAYLDDTWLWNGSVWRRHASSTSPSARSAAAIAYHAPSQRVVLFGGYTPHMVHGDTWTFDGLQWSQFQPANTPSPRTSGAMASSPQELILFGGATLVGSQWTNFDDTWRWDGSDWTQLQTPQSPPPNATARLVYADHMQKFILFGGFNTGGSTGSEATWTFDGMDWELLPTWRQPTGRGAPGLAYDEGRSEVLVFGGVTPSVTIFDTDLWALGLSPNSESFGQGCTGSLGPPRFELSVANAAQLGGMVRTTLTALPQSFAVVAMGFSDQSIGSQQLPWSLAGAGMPGCYLLVSADASLLVVGSQQRAAWSLPIPYSAGFAGLRFFAQAFVLDPGVNAAGATVSNAIAVRIGS